MAGCKYCGREPRRARKRIYSKIFCDNKCKRKYLQSKMATPGAAMMNRIYGDEVGICEIKERKRLLHGARKGKKRAIKILKQRYNLTALWNGQEVVRL